MSAATQRDQRPKWSRWWLLSLTAGGALSAAYNAYSIGLYRSDHTSWSKLTEAFAPLTRAFSYVIPVIEQSYRVTVAAGDLKRAMLVEHLYALDWLICLVAGIGALPFIVQNCRASVPLRSEVRYPDAELERQQDLGNGLFALAALFMLWESWLGSFYGPASSMFFNRVAVNDADLYRLCLFTPLTLLFGSFPVMGFCRRRKQRALRNQADA